MFGEIMKVLMLFLLLSLLFSFCIDKENDGFLESEKVFSKNNSDSLIVELKVGGFVFIQNKFGLSFDAVLNDSRCPVGLVCVWEGNAEVKLRFFKEGEILSYTLNTYLSPNELTYENYKIKILELLPVPKLDQKIEAENYRLKLLILKNS